MEPYFWPITLLLLGVVLVFLEVFVPSGGVISVLAACSILASIAIAFTDGMVTGAVMLVAATVLVPATIGLAIKWWPHTPLGKTIMMKRPESEDEVLPDTEEFHRDRMIGKQGVARSDLLPSGDVHIEGRIYDAVSSSGAINRGQLVRVVDVHTQRLVVQPLSATEAKSENPDDVLSTPIDTLGIDPFEDPLA